MITDAIYQHRIERDRNLAAPTVPRELLRGARAEMSSPLIKVITGPRRAGKSVFAFQLLAGQNFAYINLDDERLVGQRDFDEIMKALVTVYGPVTSLLFDEIQNFPSWELVVNRLHRQGYAIVVTGSNAHLLSRELGTHLTGRHVEFRILPFSFREYCLARGETARQGMPDPEAVMLHRFGQYLETGGYPEVVIGGVQAKSYLATLFESVLFKDVVKRYRVKYPRKLHELALYLTSNHSSEYTFNAIRGALGFRSVHTVENYTAYLAESYLFFSVERYSPKLKELFKAPRKAYSIDLGLIDAVKFKSLPDRGRLLENLVALELLRRGNRFYSYKSAGSRECDFVVREGNTTAELIQVAYETPSPKTFKRELTGLAAAARDLSCDRLTCLTWNETWERRIDRWKVKAQPVWRWLMESRDTGPPEA